MKLRTLAMTVAGLVIFAATSLAQITTLEGNVIGADGKPVVGAIIKIHRTDVRWDATTKSDKRGHYIHTGVPLGTFEITCVVDGKDVDKITGVKSQLGDHPGTDFDLRKLASANNAATQALVQKAIETGQISDDLKRQMTPEQKAALEKQMATETAKVKKSKQLNDSFNEGVAALQAKQYDVAVAALEKAKETDPAQPAVWANLGDSYTGLAGSKTGAEFDDTMAKGIEAYTKSIELKPDDPATHNNYGLALAKEKKYPEAEAELKKAAELDPPTAYARFYNLGALLSNNGQAEPASKAFKAAIDSAPDNPRNAEAYYQYGLSLAAQATVDKDGKFGFPPGTVEAFQKYLVLTPTGPNAQACKDMIAQLGGSVETSFKNPNAPAPKKKK
jgi:tetratricopeptide (TPR) repeat protein